MKTGKYDGLEFDVFGRARQRRHGVATTLDKNRPLETAPHYTDDRFREQQTVFGKVPDDIYGHGGLSYVYDDRLWQWDYEKTRQAFEIAKASGHPPRSCAYYEVFLSERMDKPVVIEHIAAGVNRSNGHPYFVLGYREDETAE